LLYFAVFPLLFHWGAALGRMGKALMKSVSSGCNKSEYLPVLLCLRHSASVLRTPERAVQLHIDELIGDFSLPQDAAVGFSPRFSVDVLIPRCFVGFRRTHLRFFLLL